MVLSLIHIYGEWLDSNLVHLKDIKIPNERMEEYTEEQRSRLQKAFGYTYEQYRTSIRNMALNLSLIHIYPAVIATRPARDPFSDMDTSGFL